MRAQICYAHLVDLLAPHLPQRQQQLPGLLLVREHSDKAAATQLRLRALTAGTTQLQLPRGRHLLQINSSELLPHSMSFYSAAGAGGAEMLVMHPSALCMRALATLSRQSSQCIHAALALELTCACLDDALLHHTLECTHNTGA